VALINAHGDGSNVSARYGDKFLGMTWASTGLLLVGTLASFMNVSIRGAQVSEAPALAKDEEEG
jgi:ABC-type polysaccharide/polyol phosphate export permease